MRQFISLVEAMNWTLPPAPGTTPIPDGHVRLYHQTRENNLGAIRRNGIQLSHALGIEGPRAIYADPEGFYGKPTDKPTVEFHVPAERWKPPHVKGNAVAPNEIIAIHRPWHDLARYMEREPELIRDIIAGQHDNLLTDPHYGRPIRFIKHKYGGAHGAARAGD